MIRQMKQNGTAAWARVQAYARAWRCPDKVLVIESDDWGSIRTSSAEAYHSLISRGYEMGGSCWSVDALETDDDLTALYKVLTNFRDSRGCPACITGNMVMANPDFSAILASGFRDYIHEPISTTLDASPVRQSVGQLWIEGMKNKCFRPQFHAREHVRWWEWIAALQNGSLEAIETFTLGMCGVPSTVSKENQSFFEPPYIDSSLISQPNVDLKGMISDGVRLFEKQFGFQSLSTIAPNCAWTDDVEKAWETQGIRYIQGGFCQHFFSKRRTRDIPHYLGERSRCGGWYLVRNCTFEPAKDDRDDCWASCLAQIERAFRFKTPAIVTSHRVNYIGSIKEINRERGLNQMTRLLEEVTSRWPDVYFLSSAELGYMVEHGFNQVRDLDGLEDEVFPLVPAINAVLLR